MIGGSHPSTSQLSFLPLSFTCMQQSIATVSSPRSPTTSWPHPHMGCQAGHRDTRGPESSFFFSLFLLSSTPLRMVTPTQASNDHLQEPWWRVANDVTCKDRVQGDIIWLGRMWWTKSLVGPPFSNQMHRNLLHFLSYSELQPSLRKLGILNYVVTSLPTQLPCIRLNVD